MNLLRMRCEVRHLLFCCPFLCLFMGPRASLSVVVGSDYEGRMVENGQLLVVARAFGEPLEIVVKTGDIDADNLGSWSTIRKPFSCDLTTSQLLIVGTPGLGSGLEPFIEVVELDRVAEMSRALRLPNRTDHRLTAVEIGRLQEVAFQPAFRQRFSLKPLLCDYYGTQEQGWYDVCGSDDRAVWLAIKYRGEIILWMTRTDPPHLGTEVPPPWKLAAVLTAGDVSSPVYLADKEEHLLIIENSVVHRLSKAQFAGEFPSSHTMPKGGGFSMDWGKELVAAAAIQRARTASERIELRAPVRKILRVDKASREIWVEPSGGVETNLKELMRERPRE